METDCEVHEKREHTPVEMDAKAFRENSLPLKKKGMFPSGTLSKLRVRRINQVENEIKNKLPAEKWALGISIIQGSDNNVYIKDLVKNGPGARSGLHIGDQVSLELNLYQYLRKVIFQLALTVAPL